MFQERDKMDDPEASDRLGNLGSWLVEHRILLLILLIAAIIRLYGLSFESFWLDEAMTGLRARMGYVDMLDSFAYKDHVPFYFSMIWVWGKVFGTSAVSLRMPSVIFGILTIIPIYLIGNGFSKRTGQYAALITAIIPTLVYFSQEARMYSFMVFLSSLSIHFLLKSLKTETRRKMIFRLLFLTSNMILVFTHYYGLVFIGMECISIFLIVLFRSHTNGRTKVLDILKEIWPAVISILSIVPWLVFIKIRYPGTEQTTGGGLTLSGELIFNLYLFLGGYYRLFYDRTMGLTLITGLILFILAIFGIMLIMIKFFKKRERGNEMFVLLPLVVLPPVMIYSVSLYWQNLFNYRYFLFMSSAYIVLSTVPLTMKWTDAVKNSRLGKLSTIVAISSICLLLLASNYNMIERQDKDDWGGAVEFICDNQGDNDLVIPQPAHYRYAIFYYSDELTVRSISDNSRNVSDLFDKYDAIWVITFHYRDIDRYGFTRYLDNWSREDYDDFNGLNLRKYWK
ncbi:MAG: glycosyltransferase family 39 protein [Thermoplasmatota archaeon]